MTPWRSYLREHSDRFVGELIDFLRIASISSLPEHASDVERAAGWVADRLRAAGVEQVRLLPTGGHPLVYGEWLHAPHKPTVLIYGHFDTQPVDPLQDWSTPPFEPAIREGRVYARGASDNKGNLLIPILAVEALLSAEEMLPLNVKFLFEGEEEIGSPHLAATLAAETRLFACDLVLNADALQWGEDQPALTVGYKGLGALQLDVQGARTDLHSGIYGGAAPNPLHALAQILCSMRSDSGCILVEGFHDDVVPLTASDREHIAAVPFDEAAYRERLGVPDLVGETGYTPSERLWARPTLEVNGLWGGFQGEGIKTVIPGQAHAKISCRLVPDQDPARIVELVAAHIRRHAPPGVTVTIRPHSGTAKPYLMPYDHPANRAAAAVLAAEYRRRPYYVRSGGTVPVLGLFLSQLGVYTVNLGFSLEDEQFHAPDEFFRLSSFRRGQEVYGRMLEELGRGAPA